MIQDVTTSRDFWGCIYITTEQTDSLLSQPLTVLRSHKEQCYWFSGSLFWMVLIDVAPQIQAQGSLAKQTFITPVTSKSLLTIIILYMEMILLVFVMNLNVVTCMTWSMSVNEYGLYDTGIWKAHRTRNT